MKNKIYIIFIAIILVIIGVTVYDNIYTNRTKADDFYNNLPVYYSHASYIYDTSTKEKAFGASSYVFIAKINSFETTYQNNEPITTYDATVIENIKGNLVENIKITQQGGISKDKKSYTFIEGTSYLNKDEYYLILTGTNDEGGFSITNKNRVVSLGNNADIINKALKKEKYDESNNTYKTINEYLKAKDNEEIPVDAKKYSYLTKPSIYAANNNRTQD
jgi:hypothetical protein